MFCVQPMRISFAALLGRALPMGVLVGLAGAYPTWLVSGHGGLLAQAFAGGIVLAAVLMSALIVAGSAFGGPARATWAFVGTGLARVLVMAALGAIVLWRFPVCTRTFLVWLAIFYLALLAVEGAWLCRALRRDAQRVSLGEIRRPSKHLWNRHRIR